MFDNRPDSSPEVMWLLLAGMLVAPVFIVGCLLYLVITTQI